MVRVRRGSEVRIAVENHLPEGTTLHWHGIRLPNPMDGVPGVTQPAIAPGDRFVYEFRPADAGTFFYHSHAGLQLDTGIQGPLVVEDPSERAEYDEEAFLQLDDWLDGLDGLTPQTELAQLKARAAGKTMMMPAMTPPPLMSSRWPGAVVTHELDKGDVQDYPLFLITGRPPESPHVVTAGAGKRVRLRTVNAGSDTAFAFFVEGQTMTVTHADSVPVRPVRTEGLVMGPGERYDAIVEVPEGVTRLIAAPMDRRGWRWRSYDPPAPRSAGAWSVTRTASPSRCSRTTSCAASRAHACTTRRGRSSSSSARSKASTSGSSRGRATRRPSRCRSGLESTSAS